MSWASPIRPAVGAVGLVTAFLASAALPGNAGAQDESSPLPLMERIARADAALLAPPGAAPVEMGPVFLGLPPGETLDEETRAFFNLCAVDTVGWAPGSQENLFHFHPEGDFVQDDGILIEVHSAAWGDLGVTVDFVSYTTRRHEGAATEIWANPSTVQLDPPDAPTEEWALITWTSQSGNQVTGSEDPSAEGLEHRSPEEVIRTLSSLLAEQSERISALEEVVADLRREVLSLSEEGRSAAGSEFPSFPTFTPYTVSPEVENPHEVRRVLREEQQPLVAAGIGGTVRVWFLINEEGEVQRAHIIESSGYPMLDAAAMNVADVIRFTPALNRDKPVSVWISYPITFTVRSLTP